MRTSSIRSQDDPLSIALRPSPSETESDRQVRLQREAEARRISEQIDEELRNEREKLKKYKSDVKVPFIIHVCVICSASNPVLSQLLLLGQAESGKSTLQKQFQLMYSPASLESERVSWRTVVYFNVVRSVKKILGTLEVWDDIDDGSDSQSTMERQELSQEEPLLVGATHASFVDFHLGTPSADLEPPSPSSLSPTKSSISDLRHRLRELVNTEPQLADRLSGGISVSGSGKGEVYVRSGWQARTIHAGQKLVGRRSKRVETENVEQLRPGSVMSSNVNPDTLVDEVATMLDQLREDITTLWEHPIVRALIAKRKLKLDEWSEL